MGQRFWACHNHWVGHSHFGTEATKLLRPWLFWANFDVHSGLLTDTKTWWWPCEYTTLFGPHLVPERHFRAPWSSANSQKVAGGCAPSNPTHSRGDTPLKIPPCVCFSPQSSRQKNHWFFNGQFVFFNAVAQWVHHILTLFTSSSYGLAASHLVIRWRQHTSLGVKGLKWA